MTLRYLPAAIGAFLLVAPAPAVAVTHGSVSDGVLTLVSSPGEANAILVQYWPPGELTPAHPAAYTYSDSRGEAAGPGCEDDSHCPAAGITEVRVLAGDGDDRVDVNPLVPVPAHVFGGDGHDRLSRPSTSPSPSGTSLHGEAGDDELEGSSDLFGGPGDDSLAGSGRMDGGDGDDKIWSSGPDDEEIASGSEGPRAYISCGAGQDDLYRQPRDTWTRDCEIMRGLDILALGCEGELWTVCYPDRAWRVRFPIGGRAVEGPSKPVGAPRAATGTVYLRTHFRVTPPGGGSRRYVRLGPAVEFSVSKGRMDFVRYPLNAKARRLVRGRPRSQPSLRVTAIVVARNEGGFLQKEPLSGFGICPRSLCGAD